MRVQCSCQPIRYSRSKPKYLVYVESSQLPRRFHYESDDAFTEAVRLSEKTKKKVFLMKFAEEPSVVAEINGDQVTLFHEPVAASTFTMDKSEDSGTIEPEAEV